MILTFISTLRVTIFFIVNLLTLETTISSFDLKIQAFNLDSHPALPRPQPLDQKWSLTLRTQLLLHPTLAIDHTPLQPT